MEEMFKEKMLQAMWTSQVYGHHDKMARTKTQRSSQNTKYTKTFMCKHSLNTSLPLHKVSPSFKAKSVLWCQLFPYMYVL